MIREDFMIEEKMVVINQFSCCRKDMVTVIINNKVACVMTEAEYNRMIENERKNCRSAKLA
jgi:hypothetical protein